MQKELLELLRGVKRRWVEGDTVPLYQFSSFQISSLQDLMEKEVRGRNAGNFQTLQECKERVQLKLAGDMLYNAKTGYGTLSDPTVYTRPIMPVLCGPSESASVYAGGGLPAAIIDKKATAMVVDGATFISPSAQADGKKLEFWDLGKLQRLEEAAWRTGLNDVAGDAIRDAYLFGGALLYPVFQRERPSSLLWNVNRSRLERGCIRRWVEVDRWNTVFVPSFIPTAADYLHPKTVMVAQEAVEISTTRTCILRPKPMPYWSILANLGWSPSDIAGWIQAYYAYEITQMSLPVMAQQMSLLLYRMPIDALNATVGVNQVDKLMEVNENQMRTWSALSPKAVNMVGEVEVVNRTFTGFEHFVSALKSDLAAQTEIPEPSLWHTPNKGFSDNTQESLLKSSETLQMRQHYIERYMQVAKDMLVAHVWGSDSEEWRRKDEVRLRFDRPMITTEKDLSDVGAKFAAATNSFVQAGMAPDTAMRVLLPLYPSIKLTDEDLSEVQKSYKERQETMSVGGGGNQNTGRNKVQKGRSVNGTGGEK